MTDPVGHATFVASGSADDAEPETTSFAVAGDHLSILKKSGVDIELRPGDVDEVEVTRWFSGDADEAGWDFADDELTLATDCGFLSSCDVATRSPFHESSRSASTRPTATSPQPASTPHWQSGPRTAPSRPPTSPATSPCTAPAAINEPPDSPPATFRQRRRTEKIDLAFDDAPSSVAVTTDNGAVTLQVPDQPYAVAISTDNGSVDNGLTRDDDSTHGVEVTTENGDIDLRTS